MGTDGGSCDPQRPMRADARRNYERLVATAQEVFTTQGPDAPLDDIARRAGVGPGTLYRHFPNREALLEAVYRDKLEQLTDRAYELLNERTPEDALAEWIREQVRWVSSIRGLTSALKAAMATDAEAFSYCKIRLHEAAEAVLEAARETGAVRSDIEANDLLRLGHGIAVAADLAPESGDLLVSVMINGLKVADKKFP